MVYNPHRTGLIQLHTAILIASGVALFGKLIALSPATLTAGRTAFATMVLLVTAWIVRTPLKAPSTRDGAAMALSGVLLAIHWFAFFQAIAVSSIAIALVATASFPLFTTFLEPLVFGERLRRVDVFSAVLTAAGLLLVAPAFDITNHLTQGLIWGIIAALAYALITLLNRGLGRRNPAVRLTFYQQTVAAVCTLPFAFGGLGTATGTQIAGLAVLGLVFTALAQGLVVASQRTIRAQTVGVLFGLEPVYGSLYAFLFIGEIPSWRTILGGLLICGAGAWAGLVATRRQLPAEI